jgi:hypothetical protein
MSRTIPQVFGPQVSGFLSQFQLGSGIIGGVEISVRSIQLALNLSPKKTQYQLLSSTKVIHLILRHAELYIVPYEKDHHNYYIFRKFIIFFNSITPE